MPVNSIDPVAIVCLVLIVIDLCFESVILVDQLTMKPQRADDLCGNNIIFTIFIVPPCSRLNKAVNCSVYFNEERRKEKKQRSNGFQNEVFSSSFF